MARRLIAGQDYPEMPWVPGAMDEDDDAFGVQGIPFPKLMDFFTGGPQVQNDMIGGALSTQGSPPSVGASSLQGIFERGTQQDTTPNGLLAPASFPAPLSTPLYQAPTNGQPSAPLTNEGATNGRPSLPDPDDDGGVGVQGVSSRQSNPFMMMPPPMMGEGSQPGPGSSFADTSPSWGAAIPLMAGLAGFISGRSALGNPNDLTNAMMYSQREMNKPRALTNAERERLRIQQELGKALPHMSSAGLKQMLESGYARNYGMEEIVRDYIPGALQREAADAAFMRQWDESGGINPSQQQGQGQGQIVDVTPRGDHTESVPAEAAPYDIEAKQPPPTGDRSPTVNQGAPDTFSTRIGQGNNINVALGPGQNMLQNMPMPLEEEPPPQKPRGTRSMHRGPQGNTYTINAPTASDWAGYEQRQGKYDFNQAVKQYIVDMRQTDHETPTPMLLEQARQRAAEDAARRGAEVPKEFEQYLHPTEAQKEQEVHRLVLREVDNEATRLLIYNAIRAQRMGQPMEIEPGAFSHMVDQIATRRGISQDAALKMKHELANQFTALVLNDWTNHFQRQPTELEKWTARNMVAPWFGNNVPDDWNKHNLAELGLSPEAQAEANAKGIAVGQPGGMQEAIDLGEEAQTRARIRGNVNSVEGGSELLRQQEATRKARSAPAPAPTEGMPPPVAPMKEVDYGAVAKKERQAKADDESAKSVVPPTLARHAQTADGLYADVWMALQYGNKLKEDYKYMPGWMNQKMADAKTFFKQPNETLNKYLIKVAQAFSAKRLETAGMTLTPTEMAQISLYLPQGNENFERAFWKLENLERTVGDIIRKDKAQFEPYWRSHGTMPETFRNYDAAHKPLDTKKATP